MFTNVKFNISRDLDNCDRVKETILENGGEVSDTFDEKAASEIICVVDKFEGEQFQKLCDSGMRIVGIRCIHDSVKVQKPLPSTSHPIFARHLEGLTICVSGLSKKKREEIKTLIQYMDGKYVDAITVNTNYLIATKVGSIKYKLATQNNITVLVADWIVQCWNSKSLVPIEEFKLPPLAGCVVSVTQLISPTRLDVQRLVETYGGEYTPNLTQKCTHLISEIASGLKYRYALEWGVHCITLPWLFESINSYKCADEILFLLPLGPQRKRIMNLPGVNARETGSPQLRRKHLMTFKRRYSGSNQSRSYDLCGIPHLSPTFLRGTLPKTGSHLGSSAAKIKELNDSIFREKLRPDVLSGERLENKLRVALDVCDKVIRDYRAMAREKDLSGEIETYKRILEDTNGVQMRPTKRAKTCETFE
eukprot:TRINITY_DN5438_c1_g1_i1.p1 TRINITY_DN5438_c1_g1~~TRINITY_DN5438_c1_g1_i1.p1  ORF type:complete len:420 (-),score=53.74 TRINITY_DN5438_c1_g1_i1:161-1420(-)